MAIEKKVSAIKNSPRHLLGIQSLSVQEAKKILILASSTEIRANLATCLIFSLSKDICAIS